MDKKLFRDAIIKFLVGFVLVFALIFIPAGSFKYYNGWLFMGLLFIPMFIAGIVMLFKSPDLLRSRLNVKEKENDQKEVVAVSGLMFIIGFIIAGLNYRYNWIILNNIFVMCASILFIVSYIMYAVVLKENAYLLRTIEVVEGQKLVDSGLYGIVRHPMYMVTIILFLTIPFILNSLITFFIFLIYPFVLVKRINNEEKVLEKDLKGYSEYKKKVKYKLIPFIW